MIHSILRTAEKAVEASLHVSLKVVEHVAGTNQEPSTEEPRPDDQPEIRDD